MVIIAAFIIYTLVGGPNLEDNTRAPSEKPLPAGMYRVSKITDGDTFNVQRDTQSYTVRLIGVDTPEVVDPRRPVQCYGKDASAKLKGMLTGQAVRLESDPTQGDIDKYGRLLRYAYLADGTNINKTLIEQGYAQEYTYRIPYVQQSAFELAEQQAIAQQRGLWNPSSCPQ